MVSGSLRLSLGSMHFAKDTVTLAGPKRFILLREDSIAPFELASIVVKASSRCSTFISSGVIHCASLKPGSPGIILPEKRVKWRPWVALRSDNDAGSSGRRQSRNGANSQSMYRVAH